MTQSIVEALTMEAKLSDNECFEPEGQEPRDSQMSLRDPAVDKPISHGQIIDLWKRMKTKGNPYSLEQLLRGSQVYCPPPTPKPEPSDEYKALMARLRHEEAQRAYERMLKPPPKVESFRDRFPNSAQAFSQVNQPRHAADLDDDDVTLKDVHRQVMLILNFLVSILGVAGTLWATSRWWSLPARIFLTMGGSIVVAIAEVAVYSGYTWRMEQAKQKQKAAKEVKQIVKTWVVGQEEEEKAGDKTVLLKQWEDDASGNVRKRRPPAAS